MTSDGNPYDPDAEPELWTGWQRATAPADDHWAGTDATPERPVEEWVKPEPALAPPLPDFPTKRLPQVLRDMVEAASREVQTPVAMAAMLGLAVGASTLAGKVEVIGRAGHTEQLPLWVFTAANTSERKTPTFNLLRQPLIDYEQEHEQANGLERQRQQFKLKVLEGQIKALQGKAIKNTSADIHAEVEATHMELEELRIPPRLQLWVASPTPEAVHGLLSENEGRMAVFSDEGGMFGIIAGRYAGKSGGVDIDPFLSGYVGSPLRAPRVTAERKNVAAAYLTMGFAVQPAVLADLGAVAGAEERGLIGRFLFALPESRVGYRMYGESEPIPDEVKQAYARVVARWASMPVPAERHRLMLAPDAFRAYSEFFDRTEKRLRGDLKPIESWGGKIGGTTLRVAAILHVFEHDDALERSISLETVLNAAALTEEFFIPHAFAAFRVMRQGAAKSVVQRLVAWIASKELKEFKLRDAVKQLSGGAGGKVQANADVVPALEQLRDGGYVREGKSARADSVRYEVNPLWDFC